MVEAARESLAAVNRDRPRSYNRRCADATRSSAALISWRSSFAWPRCRAHEGLLPRFNIAPTQDAPVVRMSGGSRRLDMLRWGLIPSWADDASSSARTINARSETAAEKPSFRDAFRERRCLVPADAFYEWKKVPRGKQPYAIRRADDTPLAFAGLWESWRDPSRPAADAVESFTILTTTPNQRLAGLHDRMPVILSPGDFERWLDPDLGRATGHRVTAPPAAVGAAHVAPGQHAGEHAGQ